MADLELSTQTEQTSASDNVDLLGRSADAGDLEWFNNLLFVNVIRIDTGQELPAASASLLKTVALDNSGNAYKVEVTRTAATAAAGTWTPASAAHYNGIVFGTPGFSSVGARYYNANSHRFIECENVVFNHPVFANVSVTDVFGSSAVWLGEFDYETDALHAITSHSTSNNYYAFFRDDVHTLTNNTYTAPVSASSNYRWVRIGEVEANRISALEGQTPARWEIEAPNYSITGVGNHTEVFDTANIESFLNSHSNAQVILQLSVSFDPSANVTGTVSNSLRDGTTALAHTTDWSYNNLNNKETVTANETISSIGTNLSIRSSVISSNPANTTFVFTDVKLIAIASVPASAAGVLAAMQAMDATQETAARTAIDAAASGHSHTGYAQTGHTHTGYAQTGHTHSAYLESITVQEEGTPLTGGANTLNFVGSQITATGTGSTKTITVSAAAPSHTHSDYAASSHTHSAYLQSITVQDEGTPLTGGATTLNFAGAGVAATGNGAAKTITIPGGLSQSEVDARVASGVAGWAETGNTSLIPSNKLAEANSRGAQVAITGTLGTSGFTADTTLTSLFTVGSSFSSSFSAHASTSNLTVPFLRPNSAVVGLWIVSKVNTTEFDECFIGWDFPTTSDDYSTLAFSSNQNIRVHITTNSTSGTNHIILRGGTATLPANSTVEVYLAVVAQGGGQGGSTLTVQDEGTDLSTDATTLNFTGDGVTASGTAGTKTINIPGGSGSTLTVQDEGTDLSTDATTLNFTGDGVTAAGTGATKTITIESKTPAATLVYHRGVTTESDETTLTNLGGGHSVTLPTDWRTDYSKIILMNLPNSSAGTTSDEYRVTEFNLSLPPFSLTTQNVATTIRLSGSTNAQINPSTGQFVNSGINAGLDIIALVK